MVSRCANPDCGAPFLYLRQGKLFVMPRPGFSARHSRVEYFWLCGNCAGNLTIESFRDGGVPILHPSTPARHPFCNLLATAK
jgi:hypothetical protein